MLTQKRTVFGKKHGTTTSHEDVIPDASEMDGLVTFSFEVARLQGKVECKGDCGREGALRLLTPVTNVYSKGLYRSWAKFLECFGGAGYIEDASSRPVTTRRCYPFGRYTNVLIWTHSVDS